MNFEIVAKRDGEVEIIDTASRLSEARNLANAYQRAYGSDFVIWSRPVAANPLNRALTDIAYSGAGFFSPVQ